MAGKRLQSPLWTLAAAARPPHRLSLAPWRVKDTSRSMRHRSTQPWWKKPAISPTMARSGPDPVPDYAKRPAREATWTQRRGSSFNTWCLRHHQPFLHIHHQRFPWMEACSNPHPQITNLIQSFLTHLSLPSLFPFSFSSSISFLHSPTILRSWCITRCPELAFCILMFDTSRLEFSHTSWYTNSVMLSGQDPAVIVSYSVCVHFPIHYHISSSGFSLCSISYHNISHKPRFSLSILKDNPKIIKNILPIPSNNSKWLLHWQPFLPSLVVFTPIQKSKPISSNPFRSSTPATCSRKSSQHTDQHASQAKPLPT